jgi:hypothetical protein
MSVETKRVAKVIVNGQWITVRHNTFQVTEYAFTVDGAVCHPPIQTLAYRFTSETGDEYYGPLSALELIKVIDA